MRKKVINLQIEYNDYKCKYAVIKLCTWIVDILQQEFACTKFNEKNWLIYLSLNSFKILKTNTETING